MCVNKTPLLTPEYVVDPFTTTEPVAFGSPPLQLGVIDICPWPPVAVKVRVGGM